MAEQAKRTDSGTTESPEHGAAEAIGTPGEEMERLMSGLHDAHDVPESDEPGGEDMSESGIEATRRRVAEQDEVGEELPQPRDVGDQAAVRSQYEKMTRIGAEMEGEGKILGVKDES